jgi:Flp pilus assembly pilin Flp
MVRRLVADENGLSNLKWALLIAAVAAAAVMYFPQFSFVTAALPHLWSWLSLPMIGL